MPRLLFEKTQRSIWISHLDLMRLFQRAFQRAGLHLKHTQGFNPRPSVSIALPLSVGVSSRCELLDFDLENNHFHASQIQAALNNVLVEGIQVLSVYETGKKLKELSFLSCRITLEYDHVLEDVKEKIETLFRCKELIVEKRSKNGTVDQDIIPLIKEISISNLDDHRLCMDALICCQNPTLNPAQIVSAIIQYLPDCTPNHYTIERLELYDTQMNIFR